MCIFSKNNSNNQGKVPKQYNIYTDKSNGKNYPHIHMQ